MHDWQGKRYWLIGASEGLGAALAEKLSRVGVNLVLSARNAEPLQKLADRLPGRAVVQTLDVQDADSIRTAAEAIGEVDGVVFLAGAYWPMSAKERDAEKAETMFDVNLTGLARTLGVVLPPMVARDKGHVVITGSLSGFRGLPGAIGYAASKAGVMALAESVYADLKDTGVRVQLANPGFIKTRLTDKNDFKMPMLMEPEDAARSVFEHMGSDRFKLSFPRPFSYVFRLGQFLPDWLYFRLFA